MCYLPNVGPRLLPLVHKPGGRGLEDEGAGGGGGVEEGGDRRAEIQSVQSTIDWSTCAPSMCNYNCFQFSFANLSNGGEAEQSSVIFCHLAPANLPRLGCARTSSPEAAKARLVYLRTRPGGKCP